MARAGGTVALNGLPPGDFPVDIFGIVMRAITLRGSIVGTRHDMARALDLAAQMHIAPTVHEAAPDEINDVCAKLRSWPVPGRIVLRLSRAE